VLAMVLVVPAIVLPRSLTHVYRVWMAAGEALGWINTRILLSVIFYGLVTPMGIIMRRFGRDPMQRRFEPGVATYRVPKPSQPAAHMTRQF
jgi:saxitoxin biosynthesis operon SxtJ-like protein